MRPPPSISSFKKQAWPRLRDHLPAEKVVIFGSQLRGGRDEWSDLDLIVVSSRFEELNVLERDSLLRSILKPDYPLDVFYYTPEEFENAVAEGGIIAEAVEEGVLLEAKRQEETQALTLFEREWKRMRGQRLQIVQRPDPPDFLCEEQPSGHKVAVEVTSLFLEDGSRAAQQLIAWERFLAHRLRPSLIGRLPGTFIARFRREDHPPQWNQELMLQELQDAILVQARSLQEGETAQLSRPVSFRLYKASSAGSKLFLVGFTKVYYVSDRAFADLLQPIIENKNRRLTDAKASGHLTVLLIIDRATTSVAEDELLDSRPLVDQRTYSNLDYVFLVRLREKKLVQFHPHN